MKIRGNNRIGFGTAAVFLILPLFDSTAAQETGISQTDRPLARYKASTDPADAAACRERLQRIHDAITSFKSDKKRLPKWLSELSPEYLDARLLVCPYVRGIADLKSWRLGFRDDVFQDPEESTSYAYEFCDKEMILWTGVKKTWREYKQRVMTRMGAIGEDAVPIVRCFAHEPILNLAFSGRIYTNPGAKDWEALYEPEFRHEDLHPEPLFFHEPPKADVKRFLRRVADTDARLLDLTSYYNAYLDESWLPFPRDADLAELPTGLHVFGDVPFDVRGLIQLDGTDLLAPYPIAVTGLPVHRTCTKIHILHATRPIHQHDTRPIKIPDGTKIAEYIVRYRSGAEVDIPIVYGRDVQDWWYNPDVPDPHPAKVVWEGANLASVGMRRRIRLFLTSWENPWKHEPVESLSLVSTMAKTAPFVVAITLE